LQVSKSYRKFVISKITNTTFMEYTQETQNYMQKYNVPFNVVAFCFLQAAGLPAADAYAATQPGTRATTPAQRAQKAAELQRINPGAAMLTQEIRRKAFKKEEYNAPAISEEEREKYTTRQGIIEEMICNITSVGGKDRLTALQALAKLQGLDKPEEGKEDERRVFVLRWLSSCRSCKLMRLFMEAQREST